MSPALTDARVGLALLRRVECILRLPYTPRAELLRAIEDGRWDVGATALDSFDFIEVAVVLGDELGVSTFTLTELLAAGDAGDFTRRLRGAVSADRLQQFCMTWEKAGEYMP